MDIEKNLVLIKGKDKTWDIEWYKFGQLKCEIKYINNDKVYCYSNLNVLEFDNPVLICHENCLVYANNQPLTGIKKILNFGEYARIMHTSNFSKVYKTSSIIIEKTCLSNTARNCFEYLKTIADYTCDTVEGESDFLSKQYSKLKNISPRSALASFLNKKLVSSENLSTQLIFPFGFNLSQRLATERAMSEHVSVIEGPPGTGKTQTILNIIANAILNDKTVAIVSNNNSATANVLEKLQKYGIDFIAASLGNKKNKEKFFAAQTNVYPAVQNGALSKKEFQLITNELKELQKKIMEMHEYQNKHALLKKELSELQTEQKYFKNYLEELGYKSLKVKTLMQFNSDKIISFLFEYESASKKGKTSVIKKLYNLFVYGIYSFNLYKQTPENVISYLQKIYYDTKIAEINNKIESITNKLVEFNFEIKINEYREKSMKLFKGKIAEKYNLNAGRKIFTEDDLWKNFDDFINEYPVILSTTHSLRNCIAENYLFDFVIIDEASQVDLVTGSLALSCAKKAVIVGDVKQLPNVVPTELANNINQIFKSFNIDEAYNYVDYSLLSSILNLYKNIPKTLLKEHYRCHPKIIGFCNQKFYNNELIILTNEEEFDEPLILYKTVKGNHARGTINQRQIDVVFEEIIPNHTLNTEKQTIGIISPYRLQANEIQKSLMLPHVDADTVHKYQGRERDIIILTTVSNKVSINDFVDNPNLINVAVSRAVNKLIIVVSEGSEQWKGTNIGDLVRYIRYNNFEMIESEIYSVFDLLYSSYSSKLLKIYNNSKKVSKYQSENLMNCVIEKVLKMPEFQFLNHILHQPLRMLIKDTQHLTDEERNYALNILTHTDFVIYNKLDKVPVLVVEVDGYTYHANNQVQSKRDGMKDNILKKYNIPIIRMKTNGSGEEKKLIQKLHEVLAI